MELVDTQDLGSCALGCAGSSPAVRTSVAGPPPARVLAALQGIRTVRPRRDDDRTTRARRERPRLHPERRQGGVGEPLGLCRPQGHRLLLPGGDDARLHLTIALLSDPDLAVHRAYGAFGEKKLYGKTVEGVLRSTFVVAEDGTLSHALYNVKATGHVAKLRRDLGIAA